MDMQGEPVGGNKESTKNTSDSSSHDNPVKEGAGAVASDSLAAESARNDGGFGGNRDSNPSSVPGSKSTFANTDTSAATTLPPARDAPTRDDTWKDTGAGEKYPEGAGGQGSFSGSHAGGTYVGGPSSSSGGASSGTKGDSYDTSGSGGAFSDGGAGGPSADKISSSGSGSGSGSGTTSSGGNYGSGSGTASSGGNNGSGPGSGDTDAPAAPSYVASVTQPFGQGKPKGSNITEGSAEDFKGPSDQDAEIGSENDPGRKAEQDFQKMTQQAAGSTAPRQGGQSGEHPYSSLDAEKEL